MSGADTPILIAYLRALPHFNEVAVFLDFLLKGECRGPEALRRLFFLRSLTRDGSSAGGRVAMITRITERLGAER